MGNLLVSLKENMGIPRNIQSFLRAPSTSLSPMQRLCRVFKGPGCYVCGLCGKRYNNPDDAWKCLTSNGLNINSIPVIATQSNTQTYFCLLCGKTYSNEPDTALCVLRDLQAARYPKVLGDHLHNLFASLAERAEKTKRDSLVTRPGIIGTSVPKKVATFKAPKSSSKSSSEPTPKLPPVEDTSTDDTSSSDQDVIQAQAPAVDETPEEEPGTSGDPMDHESDIKQKPQESEKPVLYRRPNQKPFTRDNAQYRCTVCNEKFFTKMEVETHFEEHPLVEDV